MHKKVKYKSLPQINVVPTDRPMNDLEQFLMATQALISLQEKHGKPGIIIHGEKIPYKKLRGLLYAFTVYFSQKGCFSFGLCQDCSKFDNCVSSTGIYGTCGNSEKFVFDSCDQFKGECDEQ